ncbi:MAG: hypothetical protein NWT00_11990 [Beijerinckiaceae bacterium]|nr:hypothetical protein [Beijerinckiaceae bacterium]
MAIHDILFLVAAGLCVVGALAHELAGAPKVLGPLQDTNLPNDVIWLQHFSWHVGTVAVLGMVAMYLLAVWHPAGSILALVASFMGAGFAAFGISLAIFGNAALWRTPAPYPWGIIALIGFAGVLLDGSAA